MGSVLVKAISFVLIVLAGFLLRRFGFFKEGDDRIVSKILLNITLPAAVFTSFASFTMQWNLLLVVLLAIVINVASSAVGLMIARRKSGTEKAFNIINFAGYNIGCFTMPYVQSFLGPFGVAVTCLFDTGNAIMCTGTTYALASLYSANGEKPSLKASLKKMFSSVPFDTYLILLALTMCRVRFPDFVYTISSTFGSANAFLAMLMIGMIFKCDLNRKQVGQIALTLALRYTISAAFALLIYFVLPFADNVKQVLVLVVFSPVSALTPIFTEKCGGDKALSGVINSLSIPISIVIITSILLLWPPVI